MIVLLTGGFNLHINWNSSDPMPTSETEAKFFDWMLYWNLTQVVRFPTHNRGNVLGHTHDLLLCRNPAKRHSYQTLPLYKILTISGSSYPEIFVAQESRKLKSKTFIQY